METNLSTYSRKVFVGGLPPDIDADTLITTFCRFGQVSVKWSLTSNLVSHFPRKGYAFLFYKEEKSVKNLIASCRVEYNKFYIHVSSATIKNKLVEVRPWRISDANYILDPNASIDPRKTVFVGGVPRTFKAVDLANYINRVIGGVSYVEINIDSEFDYPLGFGRIAFNNWESYKAAISARFIALEDNEIYKQVEMKPFFFKNQVCDECNGQKANGNSAQFFCTRISCLRYYCKHCWTVIHSNPELVCNIPFMKKAK